VSFCSPVGALLLRRASGLAPIRSTSHVPQGSAGVSPAAFPSSRFFRRVALGFSSSASALCHLFLHRRPLSLRSCLSVWRRYRRGVRGTGSSGAVPGSGLVLAPLAYSRSGVVAWWVVDRALDLPGLGLASTGAPRIVWGARARKRPRVYEAPHSSGADASPERSRSPLLSPGGAASLRRCSRCVLFFFSSVFLSSFLPHQPGTFHRFTNVRVPSFMFFGMFRVESSSWLSSTSRRFAGLLAAPVRV